MMDNNENIILRHHSIFSLLQERENLLEEIESLKNQLRDAGISPVRNHGRLSAPELSQPKRSSFSETNNSLRPESEDVRQVMCTYDKRSGTTDLGKQYEYLMCAFYGLRFATSDHVVDFEMTTNHQIYGDFDDICLRVKFVHGGEHTYLLQLKHTENKKRLTGNVLAAEKGDFSLLKYLKSFQNLARSDLTYILFTNRTASFEEETRLSLKDVEIVAKQHEEIVSEDLLNTNHAQESVFQFDTVEEEECCMKQFLHRFYLFANQCSVAKVKICIADNLKQLLECDIFDSFTSFMKTWWGGNFILTKNDIIAKLAELALSPYIQTISDEKCTERSRILTTAIRQFDLTLVQNLDGLVEKVWSEEVEVREVSIAAHKYGVTCQSMSNLEQFTAEQSTKVEWYLDKTPLIVKVNQAKRGQIKSAVSLLERIEPKKKVLLIGDFQKDDFPHWKVFETLYDLPEDLYDVVVQNFEVSLQGRNPICLERLFDTPRTSKIIGTRELFQMTQDALLIGDKTIDLPESYIPRTVSSNFLDVERVLNNCLNCDDLLIIIATPQFRKFLETANLNFSELVGYHQKSDSSIVLTTKCTKSQFDRVARATTKRRVHLIQILGDGSASLVLSTDNTFQSEEIRCEREPIREDEIHSVFDRPINVLCAQPGIGKSTMIKYLAKTCPPDCWSVRVNLRKFNSLLKQEPEEEEILLHFLGLEGIGNHMLLDKIKWLFFKNRKIYLFLDGLDEIESNCVDFALDYVNYIASTGVHVWVSSRQNLQEAVTTRLNIFPIDIQKLNQNEQQKYIDERLKTKYQPYEIQKISKEIFDSTVVARTHNMLGIPLQLYIITENFLDDRELYKKLSQGIFVLTKMYQIFFEGKRKHLYEKAGVQNDQQLGFNFKLHLELYEIPALKCCLDQNAFNKLQLQLNHQDHDFLETIKSEGDSFGIISQINDEDRAVFTHQTYAEYFASVWFKKNFDKLRLLRDEFNSDKYENLRMIFDIMLAQNCPLHLAVIYRNREQVKKHLGNVDMRDEGGRSPLHLICSYGSKHIPLELEGSLYLNHFYHDESQFNGESLQYREIFRDLSRCDPFELDAVFQWTPLDYAVQFQSLYPVEQFLDRHGDKINLDNLYKTLKTVNFAYYASKLGYPNLLVAAIAKNPNVVFFRIGEDKLSFLHVAVKGVNALALPKRAHIYIKIINILIDSRIDVNIKDKNGATPLHWAVVNGRYNVVKTLLDKGADVNAVTNKSETVIHHVLQNWDQQSKIFGRDNTDETKIDMKVIELLVQNGFDVNAKTSDGTSVLHWTSEKGHVGIVNLLIANGADVKAVTASGETVLHYAARGRSTDLVEMFAEVGIDARDINGTSALHVAAQYGRYSVVKTLLELGADVGATTSQSESVLTFAVKTPEPKLEVIKVLLESGANAQTKDLEGVTAVHWACERGHLDVVQLLLDHGADVNATTVKGETVLHYSNPNSQMLTLLLNNGVDVNAEDSDGMTVLHWACKRGQVGLVKTLLECGSDVNATNSNDETVLIYTVKQRKIDIGIVRVLVRSGVKINATDKDGVTALHWAAERRQYEVVKVLAESGGDLDSRTKTNETVLHHASKTWRPNHEIVKFVVALGVPIDGRDDEGVTALHWASKQGNYANCQLLVELGADVKMTTKSEETTLHFAAKAWKINNDVMQLLIDRGVEVNAVDKDGKSALHCSVEKGFHRNVEVLLNQGATIDAATHNNLTPLHYAVYGGHFKIIRLLLDRGLDLHKVDARNATLPLHFALRNGHLKEELLMMMAVTIHDRFPLLSWKRYSYAEVTMYLQEAQPYLESPSIPLMKNISTASTDQPMSTFDQIKEVVVKNVRGTMDCLQKLFSSLCCMKSPKTPETPTFIVHCPGFLTNEVCNEPGCRKPTNE